MAESKKRQKMTVRTISLRSKTLKMKRTRLHVEEDVLEIFELPCGMLKELWIDILHYAGLLRIGRKSVCFVVWVT